MFLINKMIPFVFVLVNIKILFISCEEIDTDTYNETIINRGKSTYEKAVIRCFKRGDCYIKPICKWKINNCIKNKNTTDCLKEGTLYNVVNSLGFTLTVQWDVIIYEYYKTARKIEGIGHIMKNDMKPINVPTRLSHVFRISVGGSIVDLKQSRESNAECSSPIKVCTILLRSCYDEILTRNISQFSNKQITKNMKHSNFLPVLKETQDVDHLECKSLNKICGWAIIAKKKIEGRQCIFDCIETYYIREFITDENFTKLKNPKELLKCIAFYSLIDQKLKNDIGNFISLQTENKTNIFPSTHSFKKYLLDHKVLIQKIKNKVYRYPYGHVISTTSTENKCDCDLEIFWIILLVLIILLYVLYYILITLRLFETCYYFVCRYINILRGMSIHITSLNDDILYDQQDEICGNLNTNNNNNLNDGIIKDNITNISNNSNYNVENTNKKNFYHDNILLSAVLNEYTTDKYE